MITKSEMREWVTDAVNGDITIEDLMALLSDLVMQSIQFGKNEQLPHWGIFEFEDNYFYTNSSNDYLVDDGYRYFSVNMEQNLN